MANVPVESLIDDALDLPDELPAISKKADGAKRYVLNNTGKSTPKR
jgi:hypothetical protein